jgi:hypothetical protein
MKGRARIKRNLPAELDVGVIGQIWSANAIHAEL